MANLNLLNRQENGVVVAGLRRAVFTNNVRKLIRSPFPTGGAGSGSGPCCCNCVDHCYVGTTGKSYTITSTGITLGTCTCIRAATPFGCVDGVTTNTVFSTEIDRMPTANFNTTFTLGTYSQSSPGGTACDWASSIIDTMNVSYWEGVACSPGFEVGGYTNVGINWTLARFASTWSLFLGTNYNIPPGPCDNVVLFYGTLPATEPSDCSGTLTFTNQITTACATLPSSLYSGAQFDVAIASGGTVVCTPNY